MALHFRKLFIFCLASFILAAAFVLATPPRAHAATNAELKQQVLKLTNKYRVNHGCKALKMNASLKRAAQSHTNKMVKANELSHQLAGEAGLGRRISKAGYRGWTGVAENIGVGYRTPKDIVKAWMESPGHRANILDCKYTHLGVGVKYGNGGWWWTQDFGVK